MDPGKQHRSGPWGFFRNFSSYYLYAWEFKCGTGGMWVVWRNLFLFRIHGPRCPTYTSHNEIFYIFFKNSLGHVGAWSHVGLQSPGPATGTPQNPKLSPLPPTPSPPQTHVQGTPGRKESGDCFLPEGLVCSFEPTLLTAHRGMAEIWYRLKLDRPMRT